MVQRLQTELATNEWHYVGHVQHVGLNHTVHYYNDGNIQRLRARCANSVCCLAFSNSPASSTVPFWNATSGLSARQDPDNDGGFVGDYSWLTNNEGPYDSFHSTSDGTSYFAANIGGYMMSESGIAGCAAFQDSQGTLDNGLLTYGWNNEEFQWTEDGEEEAAYNDCASQGA